MTTSDTDTEERKINSKEAFETWLDSYSSNSRQALVDQISRRPIYQMLETNRETWWIRREMARAMYEFGQTYHPLPATVMQELHKYEAEPLPYHFVHLSTKDKSKIAFTPSWEDGLADRQQQISLGKYIKKYHPHVPDFVVQRCQEYLNKLLDNAVVKFTTDFDLMYLIYRTVAPACMSKADSSYNLYIDYDNRRLIHPLRAYDYPGFQLAYLENAASGAYYARTMVWENPEKPDDKRYTRIYGDTLLGVSLDRLGFRRTHFGGAKLKRIDVVNGDRTKLALAPYIDDHGSGVQGTGANQYVLVKDDHLVICEKGEFGAQPTSQYGYVRAPRYHPTRLELHPHDSMHARPLHDDQTEWERENELFYQENADGSLNVAAYTNCGTGKLIAVFRYRSKAELDEYTYKLVCGGRIDATVAALNAFSVVVKRREDGTTHPLAMLTTSSTTASCTFLSRNHYASTRIRTVCADEVYSVRYTVTEMPHACQTHEGEWVMLVDARKITHGVYAGRYAHYSATFEDWRNPGHIYSASDGVQDWHNKKMIPVQFAVSLLSKISADRLIDSRDPSTDLDTGMIRGRYAHCVCLGLEPDGSLSAEPFRPFEHLVLYHRERGVAVGISCAAFFHNDPASESILRYMVIDQPNNRFLFTYEQTDADKRALRQLAQDSDYMRKVRDLAENSTELGQRNYFSGNSLSRLKDRWLKLLDNDSAAAETLIPQPETAVEQSVPAPVAEPEPSDQETTQ